MTADASLLAFSPPDDFEEMEEVHAPTRLLMTIAEHFRDVGTPPQPGNWREALPVIPRTVGEPHAVIDAPHSRDEQAALVHLAA